MAAQPLNVMTSGVLLYSPGRITNADRLESFLVSELARDDFQKAVHFVRSIEDDTLRLENLVQIVQSLRQQNF